MQPNKFFEIKMNKINFIIRSVINKKNNNLLKTKLN